MTKSISPHNFRIKIFFRAGFSGTMRGIFSSKRCTNSTLFRRLTCKIVGGGVYVANGGIFLERNLISWKKNSYLADFAPGNRLRF